MTPYPLRPFGEVVDINPRRRNGVEAMTFVSFVPMAAVSETSGSITDRETRAFADVAKGYTFFEDNDVLFAKITPCMENGKAAIARDLEGGLGAGSTEFYVLRPRGEALPEFVFHFIRRPSFRALCKANFTGSAGQQRIPRSFLENVPFFVPPLDEQRRIVRLLDRAAEIRRRADAARAKARAIIPALFLDMFGDPATNPKGWDLEPLSDLLDRIEGGWSPTCDNTPPPVGAWGVLKLSAVKASGFDPTEAKNLPDQTSARPDLEVRNGDLLFSRKNTLDLVGTAAVVTATRRHLMLPDTIFRLCPATPARLAPRYLCELVNLASFRPSIRQLASGSAASMPGISKGRLLKLMIPLPPLPLQTSFAEEVTRIEAVARALDAAAAKAEAMAEALSAEVFEQ